MILHIQNNLSVSDIQERFSKCFPSMKIEFFTRKHQLEEESREKDLIDPSKLIGDVKHLKKEGCLEIKSWYSVARVENDFHKLFGLNVQVFRNENGGWVQTSATDKYSLAQQNEMAEHARASISPKHREQFGEYDYL